MPDEVATPQAQPTAETTVTEASAETTQATAQSKPADFEAWLSAQPDDVRKAYEAHTGGLKSALDKERARNKKRDDDAAKAQQAEADKQLSEVELVRKQFDTLKAERDELAQRLKLSTARDALMIAAEKSKITFASKVAEQDALRFALEAAEIGDDGTIANAEDVIKSVIKEREYLTQSAQTQAQTNAAARGSSSTPVIDKATLSAWGANPRYHKQ